MKRLKVCEQYQRKWHVKRGNPNWNRSWHATVCLKESSQVSSGTLNKLLGHTLGTLESKRKAIIKQLLYKGEPSLFSCTEPPSVNVTFVLRSKSARSYIYTERSNNPFNPKLSNIKRQEEKGSRLKLGWFTRVSTINRNYSYVARVLAFSDDERRVEDFVKRVYLPARRVSWPGSNPWELFEASSASGIGSLKNRKKLGRKGKQRGKG